MKRFLRLLNRFGIGRAICLVLLFDLVVLRVWDPALLEGLRLRSFDLYQALQPRQSPLRPVVVVDIDEESLKAVGQWPWPRTIVADLVTRLTALGSVAIAFDMVFAEPDRASPDVAAESFRGLDDETRAKLRQLPSSDQVLAPGDRRLARRRRASRLPPRLPGREHHVEGADRLRHARRRSEAAPRHLPGAAAQRRPRSRKRPPVAACSRSSPSATGWSAAFPS